MIFGKEGDYQAFLKAIGHACIEVPMRVLGYCLLPNHFHLAFPIAADEHLLTVLRYLERNPVRAGLVRQAEQWRWSSALLWQDEASRPGYLVAGPVERPRPWLPWVNQALTGAELEALRRCVNRGTPFGGREWAAGIAERLGIQSTLRPRGRPRKREAGALAAVSKKRVK